MIKSILGSAIGALLLVLAFHCPGFAGNLHVDGAALKDENGTEVRLTGVNWFGLETSNMCPHGLWARDWKGMLLQVKEMGFNCIRLPWCNAILRSGATANSINSYGVDPYRKNAPTEMNKELIQKSPLEIMDIIIGGCEELGISVVLDNHSREADNYMGELVWYTAKTSEQQWINDWVFLASRYKNSPAVVGCDLDNEPHGSASAGGSQWGGNDPLYDWKSAAQRCGNAILAANPNLLIVVEGVEKFGSTSSWWGGNLRGVKTDPVVLSNPAKLVYSPHEYGPEVFDQPWFDDPAFPANLAAQWDSSFAFIKNQNKGHLLLGEFGIRDSSSFSGKEKIWFATLLSTLCKYISWTFWSLNPDSGDTGGILENDWTTIVQWKLDMLKPYMAAFPGTPPAANRVFPHAQTVKKRISIVCGRILLQGFESNMKQLTIFTVNGALVRRLCLSGNSVSLAALNLRPGTYAVSASGGTESGDCVLLVH